MGPGYAEETMKELGKGDQRARAGLQLGHGRREGCVEMVLFQWLCVDCCIPNSPCRR